MWSANVMITHLIVGYIKKISLYKMSCIAEPYSNGKNKIKVELNWSNYAAKSDFFKTIEQVLMHQNFQKRLI